MRRFRVCKVNASDNPIHLSFPDLAAKFTNGYAIPLKVKEGDEIPLDVIDEEDIRKSLRIGSLNGYLVAGKIEEIIDVPVVEKIETPEPILIEEQPSAEEPIVSPSPISTTPVVEENTAEITDLSLVKTYADFILLPYFLKLKLIRESKDLNFLREIASKTDSSQFKNNILVRIPT